METFIVRDLLLIDKPNRNNRIYSRSCVEKIVSDFHERKDKNGFVFGELDTTITGVGTKVNLDRISHQIEDMFIEGDCLKAKIKVVPTPMGNILKELHTAGVSFGFAMRGCGEVHETGQINNYNLITVDVTDNPSTVSKNDLVDQISEIMDSMENDGLL